MTAAMQRYNWLHSHEKKIKNNNKNLESYIENLAEKIVLIERGEQPEISVQEKKTRDQRKNLMISLFYKFFFIYKNKSSMEEYVN
jgi:hypothetical protein